MELKSIPLFFSKAAFHCVATTRLLSRASLSASLPLMFRSGGRECPPDLKQAVASLIYAAPRCADKEQLLQARKLLAKKYHAVAAAADILAPNCEVHPTVSFLTASGNPSTVPKVEVKVVAAFLPPSIASSRPFASTSTLHTCAFLTHHGDTAASAHLTLCVQIRDGFQGPPPTQAQQARVLEEIAKEWKISWSHHLPESQVRGTSDIHKHTPAN